MTLHFKNPSVLLGYGWVRWGHRILTLAEGEEEATEFNVEDYDIEVTLTPKFKPGWFAHKSSSKSYEVRFFEDDPEIMFGKGSWHRTDEPEQFGEDEK